MVLFPDQLGVMFASRIKHPRTKSLMKNSPENCTMCSEKATEDIFECCWCESHQHSSCLKISPDQCNVLNKVVSNVVYFCSTCLERLPLALQYYENQACVEQRLEAVETS